jgi:RNA polymerase sigma-70 factor (ECF subfamily)
MAAIPLETLTRLLDRHTAALVLYARQWCDAPEDVVQETFLALLREPKAPDNVVGWLYRVVRNRASNASRSLGRRQRHEAVAAHRGEPWLVPAEGDRLDAVAAARALEDLPDEQREIIVARLWGGLSFEEIARLTGSGVSTVYRWYHRGLATLRERLSGLCPQKKSGPKT